MYSIDSPITILFHQNLHTRVAGFLSEESEKAEMIKAVAGNNRERKVRKRGSVVWIWEGRVESGQCRSKRLFVHPKS